MTTNPINLDDLFQPLLDHLAMRLREARTDLRAHLAIKQCRGGCAECLEHRAAGWLRRGQQHALQDELLDRTAQANGGGR